MWTIPDLDVFSGIDARSSLDISRSVLPPRLRPGALGVLDISEFFGETTGGVRTYLLQKARYVESRPELRQVLVVPGARDSIHETGGVRCYRLHGPSIPTQKPYRFMLATRSTTRIVAHERPQLIEVGSAWCAPWLVHLATRGGQIPGCVVLPQQLSPGDCPLATVQRGQCVAPRAASPGGTSVA